MKNVLSRAQSITRLQQHYPDYAVTELEPIAEALGDLALAVQITTQFLSEHGKKRFASPQTLLHELYRPPPAEANFFDEAILFNNEYAQDLGFRLNNLARLLQDYLQLPQAQQLFELAIIIDNSQYGSEHPAIARDMNRLGTVLHDLGDWEKARWAYTEALRIDEAYYGADHPNVARDANNIAILLRDSGDLQGAYETFYRAFSICENALGSQHPYTQIVAQHLLQLEAEF